MDRSGERWASASDRASLRRLVVVAWTEYVLLAPDALSDALAHLSPASIHARFLGPKSRSLEPPSCAT